jgi:CheY-like chemotaxis protein
MAEIFIVEDEKMARITYICYLGRIVGKENIRCVNDAQEAFSALGGKEYDFYILDGNVGSGIDGIDLAHRLAEIGKGALDSMFVVTGEDSIVKKAESLPEDQRVRACEKMDFREKALPYIKEYLSDK